MEEVKRSYGKVIQGMGAPLGDAIKVKLKINEISYKFLQMEVKPGSKNYTKRKISNAKGMAQAKTSPQLWGCSTGAEPTNESMTLGLV